MCFVVTREWVEIDSSYGIWKSLFFWIPRSIGNLVEHKARSRVLGNIRFLCIRLPSIN